MASVYKVPIALAVLDRVDRDEVALDEALPVARDDPRRGHGEALTARFVEGMKVTVAEALERMVAGSENTPTDLLLRRIGGPSAVQARLPALAVSGLRVDRAELALFADGSGIADLPADGRCSPGCVEALLVKASGKPIADQEAAIASIGKLVVEELPCAPGEGK